MSRKKDKGRIGGPFVPVLKEMLSCPAWKTMEPTSRLLYIALKGRYGMRPRTTASFTCRFGSRPKKSTSTRTPQPAAFKSLSITALSF
jgi:hypothetical protein